MKAAILADYDGDRLTALYEYYGVESLDALNETQLIVAYNKRRKQ